MFSYLNMLKYENSHTQLPCFQKIQCIFVKNTQLKIKQKTKTQMYT